ncbi:alpha/beta fold hydrolase [Actinophytocola xanthii]|uniref:alpha/beta fold hydrolase n=1 Tax=Actinophytocola xanthii TaxID=1912961 RepID=UPI000A7402E8|nr:alpha/beta hydrolase [Actinophytocola xanthii]
MHFDEIVIETDRLDFPALTAGEGPVVVCWHGFPDHPATFGPLAEHLVAAGRRVVAPFLRGHHPATADAMRFADGLTLAADAAAVASALGGPVDVFGHDIGAGMVYRLTALRPELVRRAVTAAVPAPARMPALLTDPAQQQRLFYLWLFQLPGLPEQLLAGDRRLVDYLWSTWSPGLADLGAHRERVHALYGDTALLGNALRIYRGNFDAALRDPELLALAARSELPAEKPILLLAGADDGCVDARWFTEEGLAPGSRVEILPDAGHFLHLERPVEVARLALDWYGQPVST